MATRGQQQVAVNSPTFGLDEYQIATVIIDDDFITSGYFMQAADGSLVWVCRVDDGLWSTAFTPIGVEDDIDIALCPDGLLGAI